MEPIPVLRLSFVDDRQTGLGISSSSVASELESPQRRHRIAYHPWLRAFWVELLDRPSAQGGTVVECEYIPEHRVARWKPVTPPVTSAVEAAPDRAPRR